MTKLFAAATSLRALWEGARRAARGKRSRAEVARVLLDLEATVVRLEAELRAGSWRPGRCQTKLVADPKRRVITVAPFEDRVVHQALCAAIGPLLDRHLIDATYACRVGRGTHPALRRARRWARAYRWFVRLDARRYFPSIDHQLLCTQLERDLRCPDTVRLCARIIEGGGEGPGGLAPFYFPGDDLFTPLERPTGLPIGSLTSQHFANRYLSPVDHRAKDRLRVHAYLRYMDDMLLFDDDRERLHDRASALEAGCRRMRLRLHPWQIMPTRQGVGFLGFRILPDCVRVRRTTVRRAIARLTHLRIAAEADPSLWPAVTASVRSTFAHWDQADAWRLRAHALREAGLLASEGPGPAQKSHKGKKDKE